MVDIDIKVVTLCKQYLNKSWEIDNVEKDKRFELVIDDAEKYINNYKRKNLM